MFSCYRLTLEPPSVDLTFLLIPTYQTVVSQGDLNGLYPSHSYTILSNTVFCKSPVNKGRSRWILEARYVMYIYDASLSTEIVVDRERRELK